MSNKEAKNKLIEKYGAECFIEKLHLRKDKERRYTGKAQMYRMKQLTYHHIKMKKDGGRATVENGALLSAENHIWFHKQNANARGYMNAMFQEYKRQVDECKVEFVDNLSIDLEIKPIVFNINELDKLKYNRTQKKKEDRDLINDYYDDLER